MTKCPVCRMNCGYDEMVMEGNEVICCMICAEEPHPEIEEVTIAMRKIWGVPLCLPPINKTMEEIWAYSFKRA